MDSSSYYYELTVFLLELQFLHRSLMNFGVGPHCHRNHSPVEAAAHKNSAAHKETFDGLEFLELPRLDSWDMAQVDHREVVLNCPLDHFLTQG
ncbi:hypothetical protein HUJ05_000869 [Dendroctonus ponderosae]|nr:hypothetical protein HUJ05_000869 [Dendroctonus ponderosae]